MSSAVSPPNQNHFISSRHDIQTLSKAEEPVSNYLAALNQPSPKRNTFNSSASNDGNKSIMTQKRKSLGKVIDKILSKNLFFLIFY
jgi:hypothetical protein